VVARSWGLEETVRRLSGRKSRTLEKTRARYLEVFKLRQAQWTIAARRARRSTSPGLRRPALHGRRSQDLPETDQWGNSPRDLYCTALEDEAAEDRGEGDRGFRACMTAPPSSPVQQLSRLCERELIS